MSLWLTLLKEYRNGERSRLPSENHLHSRTTAPSMVAAFVATQPELSWMKGGEASSQSAGTKVQSCLNAAQSVEAPGWNTSSREKGRRDRSALIDETGEGVTSPQVVIGAQTPSTFSACQPFGPLTTSNLTAWPS